MKKIVSCFLAAIILCCAAAPASAAPIKSIKLNVSNEKKGVKISWKKIKGAKKYVVSRRLSTAKKYKKIKTVRTLSFIDKKIKADKKYFYYVDALKADGSAAAGSSIKYITRLQAPAKFKMQLKSNDDEEDLNYQSYSYPVLSWSKVKGAKKYELFRQEITAKKKGKFEKIDTLKSTKYEDYMLPAGRYVKYKVRAVNGKSKGAFSSVTKKYGYMDSPTLNADHNRTYDGVQLKWDGSRGAQGYKIYKSTDKGKTYKLLKDLTSFNKDDYYVTYEDKDVTIGNTYLYYVHAYNSILSSKKDKVDIAAIVFKDYDFSLCVGEEKVEPILSRFCTQIARIGELTGTKFEFNLKSENENVAKLEVKKNDDKTYSAVITGVSEGYADVNIDMDMFDSSGFDNGDKLRIKVSKEKTYDVKLKKGETDKIYNMGNLERTFLTGVDKIEVSSSDENIVKINNPDSQDFTLTGVSEGDAVIKMTLFTEYYGMAKAELISMEYNVLVE